VKKTDVLNSVRAERLKKKFIFAKKEDPNTNTNTTLLPSTLTPHITIDTSKLPLKEIVIVTTNIQKLISNFQVVNIITIINVVHLLK